MEAIVNREVSFAGVISDVQHRVSKNGKGWALFTVEDYTDTYEFRMFGEEYLKFRHFLMINSFIYIKAFVREGWVNRETGKRGDPRLQFNSMEQLQDVMDKYARKLTIHLKLDELEDNRIDTLKDVISMHKGDHTLNFVVYEMENEIKLTMPSRKQKVNISNELLQELNLQNVVYKLN